MLPKVRFKIKLLKNYINTLYYFLNPKKGTWDWSGAILKEYPVLKRKLKNIKGYKERCKVIYNFFEKLNKSKKLDLRKKCLKFQNEWNKINDKALETLSDILETKWPKNATNITSYVALNPICPRWIKKRSFDVYYKFKICMMKSVSLHEIFHFIYFEKWKKVFPKTKEKEFEMPHLVWHLSEMVPAVVLRDKRIQRIFKHEPLVYREYKTFKIKNRNLLSYIQEFYDNKKDFADFLKKSWKFIKRNKKKIIKI